MRQTSSFVAAASNGWVAPVPDLPALAAENKEKSTFFVQAK